MNKDEVARLIRCQEAVVEYHQGFIDIALDNMRALKELCKFVPERRDVFITQALKELYED